LIIVSGFFIKFVFNHVCLCNKPLSIFVLDLSVILVYLVFVEYVSLLIVLWAVISIQCDEM
jgi:hypothetical protein